MVFESSNSRPFSFLVGSQTLGGTLASQLQRIEPVGDPPGLWQHEGGDQPSSGLGIVLEEPTKLADDEGGFDSGRDCVPKGDGLEDQLVPWLLGNLSSRRSPFGNGRSLRRSGFCSLHQGTA